jgi:serine/threonine protein kinase
VKGIADYEFVQLLGEGTHGSFWLARCPQRLGIDLDYVAVKTLVHHANDADFARLTTALEHYASIDSPQLVQLYDVGQQGGILYYSGEHFPDGSLSQPARPFTRATVLAAISHAAMGAHALHEAGLAHRAIKPSNIMLDGSRAKLGDLGLVNVLNPGQTITGLDRIGSIEYLAPELVRGEPASRATDVWALGATMHRVLSGRPIFPDVPDGNLLQALRHVLSEPPVLHESLRDEERMVVASTLAPDPAQRPLTAFDLAERIGALAGRLSQTERA